MIPPQLSRFEVAWRACPQARAMAPQRCLGVDHSTGLLYSPIRYQYVAPDEVQTDVPTDWLEAALRDFVRGEFSTQDEAPQPYPGRPVLDSARISREFPHVYLQECENSLVYGPYLAGLLVDRGADVLTKLHRIICDPLLGNKQNKRFVDIESFRETLQPHIAVANRLQFILPAFPFKDQNPFRTDSPPGAVDMGELALMARLHALALAFYQVHPQGADFILLCDGRAYASIFGVTLDDVRLYQEDLVHWRNELNLENTVSIVDLADLVERCDGADGSRGQFSEVRQAIHSSLADLTGPGGSEEARQAMAVLVRGMTWNLDLRRYIDKMRLIHRWSCRTPAR